MSDFTTEDVSTIRDVMAGRRPSDPQQQPPPPSNGGTGTPAPSTNTPPPATSGTNAPPPDATSVPDAIDLKSLGVKDFNELKERWNKIPQYEKELAQLNEYKAGPKFKSDRQKFIYDFANRFEGMEPTAARQLLNVVELDLNTTPDQRIRFEAFKLRPEVKGLSEEKIHTLFTSRELKAFGNPLDEADPQTEEQKIEAELATTQAKETLAKIKGDWESTRPVQKNPDELAKEAQEYRQFLQGELTGFEGISGIKLSATDSKGEKLEGALNFKIDAEKQLPIITQAVADPQGMWESVLDKFGVTVPGKDAPDFKKWGELVTRILFMDDLLNQSYQQGASDLEAAKLKGARNVSDPAKAFGAVPPPATSEKQEMVQEYMKVAGLR